LCCPIAALKGIDRRIYYRFDRIRGIREAVQIDGLACILKAGLTG
jgi:hypothetical protein